MQAEGWFVYLFSWGNPKMEFIWLVTALFIQSVCP